MNPQQIELVQRTFALVAPMAGELANCFYRRLFQLDPTLRPLFHGDITQQGAKLMTVLTLLVCGLNQPQTILWPVQQLGERHVAYGVKAQHYDTVGEALLWTLGQIFGPAFTPEVEEAWDTAYRLLADLMQNTVSPNGT